MEYIFTTAYNQKAMTAMARTLRKTIRKKRSRRSHIFGWLVVILGLLMSIIPILPTGEEGFELSIPAVVTWLIILMMVVVLIWEDSINGYFAKKQILPGLTQATTTFTSEGYHSSTNVGESDFHYNNIIMIAETDDYFILMFSKSHAQVYDKHSIAGGTIESFRQFIQDRTGQTIQKV